MKRDEFYLFCEELPVDDNGCKIWPRALDKRGGYPLVGMEGKKWRGHRQVLENKLGRKLRDGYMALHTCDVRACVAEDHLYEGTHAQNMKDMVERGRAATGIRNGKYTHPPILRGQ